MRDGEAAGNRPRWAAGERLAGLLAERAAAFADRIAVDADTVTLTYAELDAAAARVAGGLRAAGVRPGDRVGLMFDRHVETYAALLGVLKADAAFVPLDATFPADRIAFIASDAGVSLILTVGDLRAKVEAVPVPVMTVDRLPDQAPPAAPAGMDPDPLAYVIYTSGTTGTPKGVAVAQSSICNFVRVAADLYGYRPGDRVYQGLTIAFDFSFEEIFVPLMAGATLVPGRPGLQPVGADLHAFLDERRVTALCCVPTVLATLTEDLPHLRWLLVSGEACPPDLVRRWHRPGRVMLNAYGPTETTVTSSLGTLSPDRAVTIGRPLPTYTMVILDEERTALRPEGEVGEIAIAGICLARGYLGRPDLTEAKFVPDTIGLPDNPGGRIYRSGDLGRILPNGEIEYFGRIDTQVKLRGYRIELGEIETALMACPGIAQAVVHPFAVEGGTPELVAYVTRAEGGPAIDRAAIVAALATSLPRYMMPTFIEELAAIPLSPAQKADRRALPAPVGARVPLATVAHRAAVGPTEEALAAALGEVLGDPAPSTAAHFFDDLGAHSLLMARFCGLLRACRPELGVAMRDVYAHPTIAALAAAVATREAAGAPPAAPPPPYREAGRGPYLLCGALQGLYFCVLLGLRFVAAVELLSWVIAPSGLGAVTARAMVAMVGGLVALMAVPVAAKWLLVGRFREADIPIWSLAFLRFWIVRHLLQHNPIQLLRGTIFYNLYLNALGARVALDAYVHPERTPVAADLLTIGPRSVLQRHSLCAMFKAEAGHIRLRPVTIGADVNVGVHGVVDPGCTIGDGIRVAHGSAVLEGQVLSGPGSFAGAPAMPADADPSLGEDRPCAIPRRLGFAFGSLGVQVLIGAVLLVLLDLAGERLGLSEATLVPGSSMESSGWMHAQAVMWSAAVLLGGSLVAALAAATLLPRLAMRFVVPGRVYPLFGFAYAMVALARRAGNVPYLHAVFGDSSYMVHYLRAIGYRLGRVEQTGSNFGIALEHDVPTLCRVGTGSMISDGLFIGTVRMSGTAFVAEEARIGARSYFGNNLVFPSDARTGDDVLYASKVQVPVSGEVRSGTGLLGAPAIPIPRVTDRDAAARAALDPEARRAGLRRKNVVNAVAIVLLLAAHWAYLAMTLALFDDALAEYRVGSAWWMPIFLSTMPLTGVWFVLVERASLGFGRIAPAFCTIYDPPFLRVERHWKLNTSPLAQAALGTPFRTLLVRAAGARIGRRVFDDGCTITEKTLVTVGDFATLGDHATLQGHSLEEGVFKADALSIGRGATIGSRALIHYGTRIGERATVAPHAFVMKGEIAECGARWSGNPARPA